MAAILSKERWVKITSCIDVIEDLAARYHIPDTFIEITSIVISESMIRHVWIWVKYLTHMEAL